MALDIDLLRVVQALARHGSVTAAAASLNLSQSTVSHALSRLRAHYGDPLFERSGNQLTRTPLAIKLATEAERLLPVKRRYPSLRGSSCARARPKCILPPKLLPLSGKRALNLPWPNVFRGPKLVPYLASCG